MENIEPKFKYVYLIDQPENINPITKLYDRLDYLNYKKVTSSTKELDIIVVNKKAVRDTKTQNRIDKRIARLTKKFSPKILDISDFMNLIGYDPDPKFVLWTDQYPNFNPWTGEPVKMWKD
ncbi:hypothetical protein ACKP2L_05200 [Oenococcus alcoholitolerans]|uniref:hypothetical protein n=1 Tax=Oenococcus alcoholitolerans TaxID=931074 RepID=UPI003F6E590E